MSTKSASSQAASALAKKRWEATTEAERAAVGRGLAAARWAGHKPKGTKRAQRRTRKPSMSSK